MLDSLILIVVAFVFLHFAHHSKDYATMLFSSITFFLAGLNIVVYGVPDLNISYSGSLGLILISFGAYIGFRSGIELIREVLEEWRMKKKK
jgi:hypothetical protein